MSGKKKQINENKYFPLQKIKAAMKPTDDWGPTEPEYHEEYKERNYESTSSTMAAFWHQASGPCSCSRKTASIELTTSENNV